MAWIREDYTSSEGDAERRRAVEEMFDLLWGQNGKVYLPTAVDHAYQMIWIKLIGGEKRHGERLSDVDLAAELGLSRTPVRQALHRLAQDGLVRFDPRRGFSVREFTARDIREIFEVRAALEVLALRLGAHKLERPQLQFELAQLEHVRAHMDQNPIYLFLQNDLRMHNMIIRASGNSRLIQILATIRSQHGLFQFRDSFYPGRILRALEDHERILLCLLEGDFGRAEEQLAQHIRNSMEGILVDLFGEGGEV